MAIFPRLHPAYAINRFKHADRALVQRLAELNHYNRRRCVDELPHSECDAGGLLRETDKLPAETHVRVLGFNSTVTFDESNEQVHVPIPAHCGEDWGVPNNNGLKISRSRAIDARMPEAPWQVKLEAPFKCVLCKKIVTLRSPEAWMIHVYADLKAYVCIHPACTQSFEYYHLWAEHVLGNHFPQVKRYCVLCNAEIISTPRISTRNAFIEHLVYNHWPSLSDTERTAATFDFQSFVLAPFTSYPCGLCRRNNWKSWYEFAAHVARHLEEISLVALADQDEEEPWGAVAVAAAAADDDDENEHAHIPARSANTPNTRKSRAKKDQQDVLPTDLGEDYAGNRHFEQQDSTDGSEDGWGTEEERGYIHRRDRDEGRHRSEQHIESSPPPRSIHVKFEVKKDRSRHHQHKQYRKSTRADKASTHDAVEHPESHSIPPGQQQPSSSTNAEIDMDSIRAYNQAYQEHQARQYAHQHHHSRRYAEQASQQPNPSSRYVHAYGYPAPYSVPYAHQPAHLPHSMRGYPYGYGYSAYHPNT